MAIIVTDDNKDYFDTLVSMGVLPRDWEQNPDGAMLKLITNIEAYQKLADLCSEFVTKLTDWVDNHG